MDHDKQNEKQETKYHTVGKVTIFNRGRRGRDRMIVGFTFTCLYRTRRVGGHLVMSKEY
jgi:hypothetical protein